jgi:hypothetical protein
METTETIEIETNWWQGESKINIDDLCKIEISIISCMFHSKELFSKITNSITVNDLTFIVTKKLFEHLKTYSNEVDFFNNEDERINIAGDIYAFENIFATTTLRILDSKPSQNIDLDIIELLDFSNKRKEIISQPSHNGKHYSNIVIEDEFGHYTAVYYNGIIKDIFTSYLFHLPEELCDTFKYTFEKIIPFVQQENFSLTMEINENDPQDIRAFVLSKNLSKIAKLDTLIQWGKNNNFKQSLFPRNRGHLLNSIIFELDNQNIEYIPNEFCEMLQQVRFLSLLHNKIQSIPENISLLRNCIFLGLCNNKINFLPNNLFKLAKLSTLCLHGNMLKEIPSEIGNLVELQNLTLSNNSIKYLPSTVSKLTKLKELDIENTLIDESSLKHLNLENIEKISFDDKLLPYFIKHFDKLKNINSINLSHSEYKIDNPIFSSITLKMDTENWMEEKDYKGHGCTVLKMVPID